VKKFLVLIILVLIFSFANGNSIFSEIGFVESSEGLDNFSAGMGYTGIATTFRKNFSMSNPALNNTNYNAGFFTQASVDNLTYKISGDSFDKLVTNFPKAKVIIPLMKNTTLGFDFSQKYSYGLETSITDTLSEYGNYTSTTLLQGSVNQFGLSIARNLSKLALGFKLGLNYGNKYNGLEINFEDNDLIDYESRYERIMKGINFTLGATYPISRFSFGGFYESALDLDSDNTETVEFTNNSNFDYTLNSESDYSLPSQLGLGVGYQINKEFYIESNFSQRFWTDATNNVMNERDTKLISAGVSFIPYRRKSLFPVRIGGYYKELPCKSNSSYVNEQALSLGFDVPLNFQKQGKISMAFTYGKRGNLSDNEREDSFFRFTVGFQSFDRWLNPQNYKRDKEIPEADEAYLEAWE